MRKFKVYAPAKLNLNLHIFPQKEQFGYHPLEAVNCTLNLRDTLFFENQERKIEVASDNEELLNQEENLSFKTALLLKEKFGKPHFGAKIFIKKEIPVKAGLGGGSSDAAATLKGLVKLWNLKIGKVKMLSLAKDLGMDVPCCLVGDLVSVSGFGERLRKLNLKMPKIPVVIVIPDKKKTSTAWAYQNLKIKKRGNHKEKIYELVKAIKEKKISKIFQNLHNDFEELMEEKFPVINQIKKDLIKNNAAKVILGGSGLAVVGFFVNKTQALKAKEKLSEKYNNIILSETL